MTWPFENDTSAITKKLAKKSLQSEKRRNLMVVIAVALAAFLMPQNALPEFPGCHGTASDPKEKADQINPCSNRKAVAKPPAKCQTKKKRRHKRQSELCQHCEIGNHPRPLLHILSLSAASFLSDFRVCVLSSIFVTA